MATKKKWFALTGLFLITLATSTIHAEEPRSDTCLTKLSSNAISETDKKNLKEEGGLSSRFASILKNGGMGPPFVVFFLSMTPISELRGAVILGIVAYKLPWLETSLIALAGNLIPIIPILLFLNAIMRLLGKTKFFDRIFEWLRNRAHKKGGLIERYEYLGLFLFVAVPLPVTGGWTGALIASVLRLPFWPSFISIALGVLTADILVTSFTRLGWWGLVSAAIVLPVLWFFSTWLEKKGKGKKQRPPNNLLDK